MVQVISSNCGKSEIAPKNPTCGSGHSISASKQPHSADSMLCHSAGTQHVAMPKCKAQGMLVYMCPVHAHVA
eukprot:17803-Heterococcus_DN1.PRE.4